jgi:four helix bundle protein
MSHNFEKLKVWNCATEFISDIYKFCNKLPKSEDRNLVDQLKRSAVSIALNIAEGSSSENNVEFKRYLYISKKSQTETIAILKIITIIFNINTNNEILKSEEIGKMLHGLIKYLKSN